ncbi:DNA ligase D [Ramlibacter solisilvae]|uniref:DNA ligase (ATP) n=1 Tax=Ramlibacter tataouinensis TaxID=94132 RepID=A0A127JUX5_9BURK|nr:DNA ligase D [Ramlibacter tataouinensis]AMO23741.1 ATP-dependent DNA ligase [Ramlibacter tataouinensis]
MDDRSARALRTYRAKRNFDATPEPAEGGVANESARSFVVQKHWATRLHYDFRLELDGTMKSWAVPKGPSFDTADKRMAMPTEDHPISYNSFEGTIPPGNYGAGKVIVWDKGVWVPVEDPHQGLLEGSLKFELRGHKLHGRWALVRMKGRAQGDGHGGRAEPWLLIKERDQFARPSSEFSVVDEMPDSVSTLSDRPPAGRRASPAVAPAPAPGGPPAGARKADLPDRLQPQLATLVDAPPKDGGQDWMYEIKFDGYRLLTRAEGGRLTLFTRNGNDWTHKLGQLHKALESMELPDGWYDGEIIMPSERAPADFQALQNAFDSARTANIVYYLFDLPYCAGYDLREVPLTERRAVLQRIVQRKPHDKVRFSQVFDAPAEEVLQSCCKLGLEGAIGKRRDSAYVARRSADWIKLKCGLRQEFVIGGYTDPRGARAGVGSLLLGTYAGSRLHYAGNVGTGFDEATLRDLQRRLEALGTGSSPFDPGTPIPMKAHWVRPELVCEVSFGEWTRDDRIRHSVFHGLREDRKPASVRREEPLHVVRASKAARPAGRNSAPEAAPAPAATAAQARLPATLRVSNPDRVIDAQTGTRKIDLVRYYALVAPLMMEHLKNRPIAMLRAPDGIDGQLFFQKHMDRYQMAGIESLDPSIFPGHPAMVYVARPDGLLSAAQMNVVEFHTWNGVKTGIDKPDRMTFDLDPGEGVSWPKIQEAAQLVRAFLTEIGLPSFLKTSGGKGLHIIVPLKRQFDWDTVKDFSQAVVAHLARTIPERFVAKSGSTNRVGKIFIDYIRNSYGATTVCAWSARARPGLGISVPVRWDELAGLKSGANWTVATVHQRLDQGNAPWADYEASRIGLAKAMKVMGFKPS